MTMFDLMMPVCLVTELIFIVVVKKYFLLVFYSLIYISQNIKLVYQVYLNINMIPSQ